MDCVLEDNTFDNTHANIVSGGGGVTLSGGGAASSITQTYDVSGTTPGAQTFNGANGNSITVNYVNGTGRAAGTTINNQVGQSGVPGSGSIDGSGILVGASENIAHTATVDGNTVLGVTGSLSGIELVANTDVAFNATVTNNSVSQMGGFSLAAMYTLFGGAGTETGTACLDIRNNVLDASAAPSTGSAVFMDQISTAGNYNLPVYAGSPNGESGTFCVAGTASAGIAAYQAGGGNTLIDGPILAPPGVNAGLVCGVTGAGTTCP